MIAERMERLTAQNLYLRAEVARMEGHKSGAQSTLDRCLPPELHHGYHRRKQLEREGLTLSADRVSCGRVWG
jgi:hypothetical protein